MEHSSTQHRGRRLCALLLAGSALTTAVQPAVAQPIQPFWVIPAVVADNGLKPSALKIVLPQRQASSPVILFTGRTFDPYAPPTGAESGSEAPMLALGGAASGFEIQPGVDVRLDRLSKGLSFSGGNVDAKGASFSATLLRGSLSFNTDIAYADDQSSRRDFRDPQLSERPRETRLQDLTRRHQFSAKLIDSGNLRLMVDGEFGRVSDSFASAVQGLPGGRLVLPGSWSTLNSRLEFGRANVSVGYQDYETRQEAQQRGQVVVGFSSSELQIYRKQGSEFNLINGGQWLKRTSFSGINADLIVADVLPDAVADTIEPIRPFLPTSISGGFERGDIVRSEFVMGPRDKVSTANLAMTWNMRLGETTASYWARRVNTDLITPGVEDGMPLSRSSDRYADITHSVRRGSWKFGAGLSLIETDDTLLGVSRSGREMAPHVSVAYAPEHGPKVELRYGAADAQSQLVDDNLAARAKKRQLQLSIDVSDYVQEELNRPDAKLKLEYRYDFSGSDQGMPAGREKDGGHALLVTFSTPLN